jgi:1-acyl-sn-glycerol-3-phosphate acyltransferase
MQRVSADGTDTGQTDHRRAAERRASAIDVRARRASMQVAPEEPAPLPVVVPRNFRPDLDEGETVDPRRGDVDEWGRSEHMRSILRRVYDPMYKHWFRVEWEGMEKIPTDGGALLIGNHAGAIPSDAPAIMHGIERDLHRPVYGLADYFFRTVPGVGTMWSRTGGVPAHPDNAYRILHDQRQLALVFPEGTKGPSKTYTDRYRLRRFGRGGFVEIAMRAGVPVIPIATVGAEESMPILFRLPSVAKALRLPYFPVTANHLVFGPVLGTVAYFPSKIKIRVLDPITFDVEPDQDRYSKSTVMDEAERIRSLLQDTLHDMLRARRSVWFG